MENDDLTLLPGEQVVMQSDGGTLTLTNLRVRLDAKAGGTSKYVSITLDSVASCGVVNSTRPVLLLVSALAAIGGLVQNDSGLRLALWIFAIVLIAAYLATRASMLTISSNGGERISVPAKGMGRDGIIEFTDAVDAAKLSRQPPLENSRTQPVPTKVRV